MVVISLIVGGTAGGAELYERLGVSKSADLRELKKAWHLSALRLHPDKIQGGSEEKEAAAAQFKRIAEAYEVLSDAGLRAKYDATGAIPDDKSKAEAATKSKGGGAGDEEQFGYEDGEGEPRGGDAFGRSGWRFGHRHPFQQFEVGLAQGRARRLRSLESLRRVLQPVAKPRRFGLIGFYRKGEEASLKQRLRFPYPFAGWSLGAQGSGFWWEDALQSGLVSVGHLAGNAEGGGGLLAHFGLDASSTLPAIAWVQRDDAMSFELFRPRDDEEFIAWVYGKLSATVTIVNLDHRPAVVWWLDGNSAKKQGVVAPGERYVRTSYVSHRWYCWAEGTEGNLLSSGAALGEITLSNVGEDHELTLHPHCVDSNGHCAQWKALGECERNRRYMHEACPSACGGCDVWGWLYDAGLARLHGSLACWAEPGCAAERALPSGGRLIANESDARLGLGRVAGWLRRLAAAEDAQTRRALEQLLVPPPPPPLHVPPRVERAAAPPPPPRRQKGSGKDEV